MKNILRILGKRFTKTLTLGPVPSPRATPWRPYLFVLAAMLQFCSWEPLCAQQRDPAVEIYGLTGTYFFGNRAHVLEGGLWSPQLGVGGLFPLGSKWALMVDGVTSFQEFNVGTYSPYPYPEFYRVGEVSKQRLISVLPSVARLWRRARFSIYIGLGLGFEQQRQLKTYQMAHQQENPDGSPTVVVAEEPVESRDVVSIMPLNFRAGVLISLTPRVVVRAGYSVVCAYVDTAASQSLEVGIGYRF